MDSTGYSTNFSDYFFSVDAPKVAPAEPLSPKARNRQNIEALRREEVMKRERRK